MGVCSSSEGRFLHLEPAGLWSKCLGNLAFDVVAGGGDGTGNFWSLRGGSAVCDASLHGAVLSTDDDLLLGGRVGVRNLGFTKTLGTGLARLVVVFLGLDFEHLFVDGRDHDRSPL